MHSLCWRRKLLARGKNTFWASDEHVEKMSSKFQPHITTHVATNEFQTELISRLLLTGTHLRKQAVATLSYSPANMLHPQDIYPIALSAGLNGPQVDEVD